MIKSFTSAVAVTALGLTLFTGGVASAEDSRPVKGSAECTRLVESNVTVTNAVAALSLARNSLAELQESGTATRAEIDSATAEVDRRVTLLAQTRSNTRNLLCKDGEVTPEPTTTVVTPPRTIVQNPTTVVERPTVIDRERISTVAVVPTHDDGSVASTSGSQVTVVPEGSASTGQA